ncbi:MAG TPA: hypothetical protein VD902_21780 [Symbiobacteriaceae bacterium]|nr:hypothetical protein [Symbiobacteriaceae bacterium]
MSRWEDVQHMTADMFGDFAEARIKAILEGFGWSVSYNKPGSRGASDLIATKGTKKWYVQVKAARDTSPPSVADDDKTRVSNSARGNNAVPVIALYYFKEPGGNYQFRNASTWDGVDASK